MDEQPKQQQLEFQRDDEFAALYANNVHFESSVWDFKFIFGQLDQSRGEGKSVVEQHTAMTVPWFQAKLMAYFLAVNLTLHQNQNGELRLPPGIVPPRPDPSNPELDENGKNVFTYLAWIHDQFFGTDPYIPPGVDAEKL